MTYTMQELVEKYSNENVELRCQLSKIQFELAMLRKEMTKLCENRDYFRSKYIALREEVTQSAIYEIEETGKFK